MRQSEKIITETHSSSVYKIAAQGNEPVRSKRFAARRTGLRKARHERWLSSHRSWQIGLPLKRRGYLMAYRDIVSSASGNCAKFQ